MTLPLLICLFAALALYFAIRANWLVYCAQRHAIVVSYWARRTKQGVVAVDDLSRVWPTSQMLFDYPWHWDWARYLLHPDLAAEMGRWIERELQRSDLSVERYLAEVAEDVAAKAAQPAPAEDPSRN